MIRRLGCATAAAAWLLAAALPGQAAGAFRWSAPAVADAAMPFGAVHAITAMSCRSAALCVGGDDHGDILTSSDPSGGVGSWKVLRQVDPPQPIAGVSCPSKTECVAVSRHGDVLASTAFGKWKVSAAGVVTPAVGLRGVSCGSDSMCVAFDGAGNVISSTKPTGGRRAWKFARVFTRKSANHVASLSCPSARLCVGVDAQGNHVLSSTKPAGGARFWKLAHTRAPRVPRYAPSAISCASGSLCVIAGISSDLSDSYVASSTKPAGGGRAWRIVHRVSSGYLTSISCPSKTLCVADGDPYAEPAIYATNPTGGSGAWRPAYQPPTSGPGTSGVACGSPSMCVLYDSAGDVASSTAPASGQSSWQLASIDTVNELDGVSCPSAALCVAGDSAGNVVTSTNPAGGGAWQLARADAGHRLQSVSCPSAHVCVAGDSAGRLASSANPTGGSGAWQVVDVNPLPGDDSPEVDGLACPSASLCIAGYYQVITASSSQFSSIASSANPTGSASDWSVSDGPVDGGRLDGVSCPSVSLCIAVDDSGRAVSSGNPANGSDSWMSVRIDGRRRLNSVSCPSASLCVAVDDSGRVLSSTKPTTGAWHVVHIDTNNSLTSVSCPSASFCVAVDGARNVFSSGSPAAGSWTRTHGVDGDLTSVSCASTSLCVAVDSEGNAIVGRRS